MSAAARDLIALAEHLQGVEEPWAAAIVDGLERLLTGDTDDVAEALGLKTSPGERHWRTTAALDTRDRILREAATRFFPNMKKSRQAEELGVGLRRYGSGPDWRRDRELCECPYPVHLLKFYYWALLRAIDNPLSDDRIRRILGVS